MSQGGEIQHKKFGAAGGTGFPCPKCHAPGRLRSSETLSHLSRRLYYQCRDIGCGHTWKCINAFEATISPSAHGPVDRNAKYIRPGDRPNLPPIGGHPAPPQEHPPPG